MKPFETILLLKNGYNKVRSFDFRGIFFIDNRFEVESAPAIVFLKDPGVKPVVYHGTFLT